MPIAGLPSALRAWRITLLITAVGLGLTGLLFVSIWSDENRALKSQLDADAVTATASLEHTLTIVLDDLNGLEAFFSASAFVSRAEFQAYTHHEFADEPVSPGVQAYLWAPLVPAAERAVYETAAVRDGLVGFQFIELAQPTGTMPVVARATYVPLYYLEPQVKLGCPLGFDLATDPQLRAALDEARANGTAQVMASTGPCASSANPPLIILRSVGIAATTQPPAGNGPANQNLDGYLGTILYLDRLLKTAMDYPLLDGLEFYLFDQTSANFLAAQRSSLDAPLPLGSLPANLRDGLYVETTITVAGHQWTLFTKPTAGYLLAHRPRTPWAVLLIGLIFTGLLDLYVWQHRRAQAHLKIYGHIVSATRDLLAFIDQDHVCRAVNGAFLRYYQRNQAEMVNRHLRDLLGHVGYQEQVRPLLERAFQGEEISFETWLVGGATPRFVEVNYSPHRDRRGQVVGVVINMHLLTERKLAEQALADQLAFRQTLIEAIPAPVFYKDATGHYLGANSAFYSFYGLEETQLVGRTVWDIAAPDLAAADSVQDQRLLASPGVLVYETQIVNAQGQQREVTLHKATFSGNEGAVGGIIGVILDISERKAVEGQLRQAATVFENTLEGVMITDPQLVIVAINRAFSEITGYSESEAIGNTPRLLQSGRHSQSFYEQMWVALNAHGRWQGEIWNQRKSGEVYPEWVNISSVVNEAGQVVNYIAVFSDISHLKNSEEQLAHLVHYDPLTDLPNRLLLYSRIEHALERARRYDLQVAVLFIDLDRFKNVNDSLGHPVGDSLLVAITQRLKEHLRNADTLARLGGDEFVVLLEDLTGSEAAAVVARELIELLGEPFMLAGGQEVFAGGSIGISIGPADADSATRLIRNADTAMYQAKANGGATFQFYTTAMTQAVNLRLDLEGKLRRALERQEFLLYYQPQVNLETGQVIGVEALIRWHQPEQGLISPAQFIPVAEETGLIVPIGAWVLRAACAQLRAWRNAGHQALTVSINLSTRQFRQQDLLLMIEAVLVETGLLARHLELEITESAVMEQPEQAIATLQLLREHGIRLAIDDFGTGYSSLSYLQRFALNRLKIDRSFIKELPTRARDASIAATIIAMAHNLGLDVLAEGVETVEQLAWLRSHHCDAAQGYLFSRPLPPDQLADYLVATNHAVATLNSRSGGPNNGAL